MQRGDTTDGVPAGPFGDWLAEARAVVRGESGSDVPCGDCVGCCVSSYYILLRPQDTQALAAIPAEWVVAAPGQPGSATMGYLPDGTCPMLCSGQCSIYRHRPQTCRDYDCRVFAAAGIAAGGDDKAVINRRVHDWRFSYATEADTRAHDAVRAAASFIRNHAAAFPGGRAPTVPAAVAILAIKVYEVFLDAEIGERTDAEIALAILEANRRFEKIASA